MTQVNRTTLLVLLSDLATKSAVCPSCGCRASALDAPFKGSVAHYADCALGGMLRALIDDKSAMPTDVSRAPWTPFERCTVDASVYPDAAMAPHEIFMNSRYQVAVWEGLAPEPYGHYAHLSIKTNDRSAAHDWRDYQRIKNEIVGHEFEAVELYPAESRLVDNANQYHLWCFREYQFPFGFPSRLVSDGGFGNAVQRPFEVRPADCLDDSQYQHMHDRFFSERKR